MKLSLLDTIQEDGILKNEEFLKLVTALVVPTWLESISEKVSAMVLEHSECDN